MKLLLRFLISLAALALLIVVIAFGCAYLIESLGPGIAAERIKAMTGFRLDMAGLKLSLVRGSLELDEVHLKNPVGWPEEEFLSVNKAAVTIQPSSFAGNQRRVYDEVILDLGPVNFVTDSKGNNNASELLKSFKIEKQKTAENGKPKTEEGKKVEKPSEKFVIRHLILRISSVRYMDYSRPGGSPTVIPVNCEIEMNNVTDLKQVQKELLSKISRSFLMGLLESTQWNTGGC